MKRKISLNFKRKKVIIELEEVSGLGFFVGLMFKGERRAKALLFDFKKSVLIGIHSFFCFVDFMALWIDESGKIIEKKVIKPFSFSYCPAKPFVKLVEIPITPRYSEILSVLVDKQKI